MLAAPSAVMSVPELGRIQPRSVATARVTVGSATRSRRPPNADQDSLGQPRRRSASKVKVALGFAHDSVSPTHGAFYDRAEFGGIGYEPIINPRLTLE